MKTDTPETDGEWNRLACQDHPATGWGFARKSPDTTNHENTMQTENDTSKLEDSPEQEDGEGCSGASCSRSLLTDRLRSELHESNAPQVVCYNQMMLLARKLESALRDMIDAEDRHGYGASMSHPRVTRARSAAVKILSAKPSTN